MIALPIIFCRDVQGQIELELPVAQVVQVSPCK